MTETDERDTEREREEKQEKSEKQEKGEAGPAPDDLTQDPAYEPDDEALKGIKGG